MQTIAVEPRSGWLIIKIEIINSNDNGFKKPLSESISDILLIEYPEM